LFLIILINEKKEKASQRLNILFFNFIRFNKLFFPILIFENHLILYKIIIWGLGIGDWGLGIGDWANPQSPIPNPQSPIPKIKN